MVTVCCQTGSATSRALTEDTPVHVLASGSPKATVATMSPIFHAMDASSVRRTLAHACSSARIGSFCADSRRFAPVSPLGIGSAFACALKRTIQVEAPAYVTDATDVNVAPITQ